MYFQLQYLKHFLTASNQHGVHSPFVYDFVTKCLYSKSNIKAAKSVLVVLKCIPYFSIENFKIISKDSSIEKQILRTFGLKAKQKGLSDFIYLDNPLENVLSIHRENIHNDTIILVDNIHKTKAASADWNTLIKNKVVTVSIDMLHCGLISLREEQVKEHFKIRI